MQGHEPRLPLELRRREAQRHSHGGACQAEGFVDALRTVGYDGPLSIENEDALLPGTEGVRRAAQFLHQLL